MNTSSLESQNSWLPAKLALFTDRLALVGASAFALGYVPAKALANIGLGLLLIAFLLRLPDNWRWLGRDPLVRLSGIWALLLIILAWRASAAFPETTAAQFNSILEVFSFGFIPLIAWVTRGDFGRVRLLLGLALAGIVLRILWDGHWFSPGPLFDYQVKAFGVNKNIAGVMMDTAVVGVLLYTLHQATHIKNRQAWAGIAAAIVVIAFLLLPWAYNPSRATWISLGISLTFMFFFLAAATLRGALGKPAALGFLAILMLLGSAVYLGFGEKMMARLGAEQETWQAILTGDWEHIPNTSIGMRIHMWHIGFELWLQHPLFGWGTKVSHLLASNDLNEAVRQFVQFHNGFVEILVRVGLVGGAFFVFAAILVFRASLRALNEGMISVFFFVFLMEAFVIFMMNNGSISFIFFQHGWQYLVLFGGLAYGYRWAASADQPSPIPPCNAS
ncbi:MAG: O-antigen ligase family protein [Pseudomonadota bacterium]